MIRGCCTPWPLWLGLVSEQARRGREFQKGQDQVFVCVCEWCSRRPLRERWTARRHGENATLAMARGISSGDSGDGREVVACGRGGQRLASGELSDRAPIARSAKALEVAGQAVKLVERAAPQQARPDPGTCPPAAKPAGREEGHSRITCSSIMPPIAIVIPPIATACPASPEQRWYQQYRPCAA